MAKANDSVKLDKLHGALLNDENLLRRVAKKFCQYLLEEEINNHLFSLISERIKERIIAMDINRES